MLGEPSLIKWQTFTFDRTSLIGCATKFHCGLTCVLLLTTLCVLLLAVNTSAGCKFGDTKSKDGKRRLAVVVGVGNYPHLENADLKGAATDAKKFYALLTDPKGFGFPKENVCLLINPDATQVAVVEAFEKGLIEPAREGDIAVFYFSGHGGQRKDLGGDERFDDGKDETLLLYDATPNKSTHLVDDRLGLLVDRLRAKTKLITLVMDSCNSASNSRGDLGDDLKVRRYAGGIEDQENYVEYKRQNPLTANGAPSCFDLVDTDIVQLAASADGTSAIELNGIGVFTDALLQVLTEPAANNLTYSQLKVRLESLVLRKTAVMPYTYGVLFRRVFGGSTGNFPLAWTVAEVGEKLLLKGLPLPGFTPGAELRIYDAVSESAVARDPGKAKATVRLVETGAFGGAASVLKKLHKTKIVPGDIAVMVLPGRESNRVTVSFKMQGDGSLAEGDVNSIRGALANDPEGSLFISIVPKAGEFEISKDFEGNLILRGPENFIRWESDPSLSTTPAKQVAAQLRGYSLQRALLAIHVEGGKDFKENDTLNVSLVPTKGPMDSCIREKWISVKPGETQRVPVCHAWRVAVSLDKDSPYPLLIGGFFAGLDGSIESITGCGEIVRLQPGKKPWVSKKSFINFPSADVIDQVVIFGVREENPLPWCDLLATAPGCRERGQNENLFSSSLKSYLGGGTRETISNGEPQLTWTRSVLSVIPVGVHVSVKGDIGAEDLRRVCDPQHCREQDK